MQSSFILLIAGYRSVYINSWLSSKSLFFAWFVTWTAQHKKQNKKLSLFHNTAWSFIILIWIRVIRLSKRGSIMWWHCFIVFILCSWFKIESARHLIVDSLWQLGLGQPRARVVLDIKPVSRFLLRVGLTCDLHAANGLYTPNQPTHPPTLTHTSAQWLTQLSEGVAGSHRLIPDSPPNQFQLTLNWGTCAIIQCFKWITCQMLNEWRLQHLL